MSAEDGPRHRRLHWIARCVLWSAPILFLGISLVFLSWLDDQGLFHQAQLELLRGEYGECDRHFAELSDSFWLSREASGGSSICRVLNGNGNAPSFPAIDATLGEYFPLRVLLHRELTSGNYSACLNLARSLDFAGLRRVRIYEAAALLELGRRADCRRLYNLLEREEKLSPLGERVGRVLSVLAQDALAVLQDRRGSPIGWVTAERELELLEGVDPKLLPLDTIQEALEEQPASSVRLSIDLGLSALARRALRGYRGSVVLLSPDTGEILAAVSDRRSQRRMTDPALRQRLEPASISKLITTTAALRSGIDPDEEIGKIRCNGAIRFEGDFLYCPSSAGRLRGLNQAMATSCNVAFASLGVKVGSKHLIDELNLFGFDRPPVQGLFFGHLLARRIGIRQLADLSIGLEWSDITPVHASMIAAVFANGGNLVEPTLFSARDGLLGLSTQRPKRIAKKRILDPEWVPVLQSAMGAVTSWGGTASGLEPSDFPVAMKTGTASTPGRGYHTNYIGFGPVDRPTVAFCVRITGFRSSKAVTQASRNVTYRLLHYIVRHREWLEPRAGDVGRLWTHYFTADTEESG